MHPRYGGLAALVLQRCLALAVGGGGGGGVDDHDDFDDYDDYVEHYL